MSTDRKKISQIYIVPTEGGKPELADISVEVENIIGLEEKIDELVGESSSVNVENVIGLDEKLESVAAVWVTID